MPRFREEPIAPLLGGLLVEVVRDDLHHGLVDLALEELHRWLVDNPETFAEVLGERAPWWAPTRLNDAVTGRLHPEAVRWLDDIRDDPQHHARQALDSVLGPAGRRTCCTTRRPRSGPRGSRSGVLEQPAVLATGDLAVERPATRPARGAATTRTAPVRDRLRASWSAFAERLASTTPLRARLDGLAADAAVFAVGRYGAELTAVITHTIERWDGKEAARRIELHVGRDLQFIRINGTIVGGLVGVADPRRRGWSL